MTELNKVFSRWRVNPLLFVQECIGVKDIEPWQEETLKALVQNNRIAIRSGHGVGKTTLLSWIILWFGSTRNDAKIPVTAPVSDQLSVNLWGEVRKWRSVMQENSTIGAWLASQIQIKDGEIVWENGNACIARTARRDNPEALAGFHAGNLLFLIDEASGVDEIIFETALGALSTPGAKQLMTGNPTRAMGYFYNAFTRNRNQYWTRRVSSEEVSRAHGHIQDVISTYGRESNQYRVRVMGEFPTQADDQLIPLEAIESSVGRQVAPLLVMPLWGFDVARFGDDRTALVKRRGNVITHVPTWWRNLDTMQTVGKLKEEYDRCTAETRPSHILVDSIGIGAGVVDRGRELNLPIVGINVGEAASTNEKFMRKRDELWWKGREWFMAKDVSIPKMEGLEPEQHEIMQTFIAEHAQPGYKTTSSGKIQIESKADIKKRGFPSPDLADANILTHAGYSTTFQNHHHGKTMQAKIDFNPMDF